jgi:hydrogenase expression/formation protein HypC
MDERSWPLRRGGAMCLAIPGQVLDLVDEERRLARVSVAGVRRTVNIALLDDAIKPLTAGDWVLVHVGFAISRVDEEEALATLQLLEQMRAEYQQEIRGIRASAVEARRNDATIHI